MVVAEYYLGKGSREFERDFFRPPEKIRLMQFRELKNLGGAGVLHPCKACINGENPARAILADGENIAGGGGLEIVVFHELVFSWMILRAWFLCQPPQIPSFRENWRCFRARMSCVLMISGADFFELI